MVNYAEKYSNVSKEDLTTMFLYDLRDKYFLSRPTLIKIRNAHNIPAQPSVKYKKDNKESRFL